jgi:hypothetical protein
MRQPASPILYPAHYAIRLDEEDFRRNVLRCRPKDAGAGEGAMQQGSCKRDFVYRSRVRHSDATHSISASAHSTRLDHERSTITVQTDCDVNSVGEVTHGLEIHAQADDLLWFVG